MTTVESADRRHFMELFPRFFLHRLMLNAMCIHVDSQNKRFCLWTNVDFFLLQCGFSCLKPNDARERSVETV